MSNFYCAAPWRGLHINPRGDVKTCCAGNPNMLGNLNTQTIEQILNGDTKPIKNRNEITPMTLTYRDLPSLKLRAIGLGTLNVFKLGKFERNFPGLT